MFVCFVWLRNKCWCDEEKVLNGNLMEVNIKNNKFLHIVVVEYSEQFINIFQK